jgi:hypothetical protein
MWYVKWFFWLKCILEMLLVSYETFILLSNSLICMLPKYWYFKKSSFEATAMPDFEQYVARHGEFGVQAIIERLERYEGIRSRIGVPLEERWAFLMQPVQQQQRLAA